MYQDCYELLFLIFFVVFRAAGVRIMKTDRRFPFSMYQTFELWPSCLENSAKPIARRITRNVISKFFPKKERDLDDDLDMNDPHWSKDKEQKGDGGSGRQRKG